MYAFVRQFHDLFLLIQIGEYDIFQQQSPSLSSVPQAESEEEPEEEPEEEGESEEEPEEEPEDEPVGGKEEEAKSPMTVAQKVNSVEMKVLTLSNLNYEAVFELPYAFLAIRVS